MFSSDVMVCVMLCHLCYCCFVVVWLCVLCGYIFIATNVYMCVCCLVWIGELKMRKDLKLYLTPEGTYYFRRYLCYRCYYSMFGEA